MLFPYYSLSLLLLLTASSLALTSVDPPSPSPSDPYARALHAVNRSLEVARETACQLTRVGARTGRVRGSAADDCLELAEMSVDELETARDELAKGEAALTEEGVDRVRTMVSSALTDVDTCMDGLAGASRRLGGMYGRMEEVSRFYEVTLGLVARAMDQVENKWKSTRDPYSARPMFVGTSYRPSILLAIIGGIPPNRTVTVAIDGSGNFTSLTKAMNVTAKKARKKDDYFKIIVKEGVYHENVFVNKNMKRVIVIGAGNNRTIITGHRSTASGWRTFNSATLIVEGEGFIACNLTLANTAGPDKAQAVAVRNSANHSIFYQCTFLGYQDTLYVHKNNQFYRDCNVYGTVDFIFGDAAAIFQNCNIYARKPMPGQKNTITAQGRKCPHKNTGISIHNCTVRAAPDLESDPGSTETYLGRPWQTHSRTVFMQSFLGDLIDPQGWLEWDGRGELDTLYYGEFGNTGPGADTTERVQWPGFRKMEVKDAVKFTVYNFIAGHLWLANTTVPFIPGLL